MDNLPGVSEVQPNSTEQEVPQPSPETPRINTEVTHPFEDTAARKIEEAFREKTELNKKSNQEQLREEAHSEGEQQAQSLQGAAPETPPKEPVVAKPGIPVDQPIVVKHPGHDLNVQGLILVEQRKRELEVAKNKQ